MPKTKTAPKTKPQKVVVSATFPAPTTKVEQAAVVKEIQKQARDLIAGIADSITHATPGKAPWEKGKHN